MGTGNATIARNGRNHGNERDCPTIDPGRSAGVHATFGRG
jgi:hypothetical protein